MTTWLPGPRRGRDDELAELRRLEIATALLLGLAAFAALTALVWLLLELAGIHWLVVFGFAGWAAVVAAATVVLAWLLKVRRRERRR